MKPKDRWRYGKNYNGAVANAIEEFGWNNVKHSVYTLPPNKNLMCALERWFIQHFDTTNPDNGYNIEEGGKTGTKRPQSVKKQISDKMKQYHKDHPSVGHKLSEESRAKLYKPVSVDCIEYKSITQAAEEIGVARGTILNWIYRGKAHYIT
jgi:hypothetical protein